MVRQSPFVIQLELAFHCIAAFYLASLYPFNAWRLLAFIVGSEIFVVAKLEVSFNRVQLDRTHVDVLEPQAGQARAATAAWSARLGCHRLSIWNPVAPGHHR